MIGLIDNAYVASSAVAAFASLSSRSRTNVAWWLVLSIGLLLLALLRIAEAGVWIDYYLRRGLQLTGSYGLHRPIQMACIAVFALGLFLAFRHFSARSPLSPAVSAFCLLMLFAAVRASSLHWSDALLGQRLGPVILSHVGQIILLIAISAAALVEILRAQTHRQAPEMADR